LDWKRTFVLQFGAMGCFFDRGLRHATQSRRMYQLCLFSL